MGKYTKIADEIRWYSEKTSDGRWIIPIALDFDYTITKCSSWDDGTYVLNDYSFKVLKKWIEKYNVGFILDTMRHDELLDAPLRVFKENGIEIYGVRKNPCQSGVMYNVPKIFAVMSIDDRNACIPLIYDEKCGRPYVDWRRLEELAEPTIIGIYNELKE